MVKSNTTIKIKPQYILLIAFFLVLGFVLTIFISNHKANKFYEASFVDQIDTTFITGYDSYGALRGAVFFKKNKFISTSAILIENKSRYNKWKSNGPIIDFNSDLHSYTLDDLALPYTILKSANSDTLFVEKEGYTLKFLMIR